MISFLARALLAVAVMVADWFVETNYPQFGLIKTAPIGLLLVFVVWVIAFWPLVTAIKSNRPPLRRAPGRS
jgi:hypothetical protein